MRKMKSLFKREFENHEVVKCLNEVEEGCEWVLNGEGWATEKLDGTCCLIEDGKIYKRFDFKPGRKLPEGAIPCQEKADPITGHFPHWVLCDENNPADKWYIKAFKLKENWEDGTYELVGKHFQGNPYNLDDDRLEKHGQLLLKTSKGKFELVKKYVECHTIDGNLRLVVVPRTYEQIREYLENNYVEGIVFYRGNGEMCKIKRSDFGFEWNGRK